MGLNSWWNDQAQKAEEFLSTGTYNDTVRNRSSYSDSGGDIYAYNKCTSSSQCSSGHACVGGNCVRMDAGGSNGQVNYPGQCNSNSPGGCGSGGPGACQPAPTPCGDGGGGGSCCGSRCCTFGSATSALPGIHCHCGDCPPLPGCNAFCESYLKANGEPGPGCSEGRDGNSCTECEYCESGECLPLGSAPCWCDDGNDCAAVDCHRCQTDPEAAGFGTCQFNAEGCQECAQITNHVCSCNLVLTPVTVCRPYGYSGTATINLAQQLANEVCAEACEKEPDPCKPKCTSVTRCTDTGTGVASCLEGERQTGTLEAGGVTCVFCETCDYDNLPESCKDCDCNCHDDCPDCQICAADGTCQPDPNCAEARSTWVKAAIPFTYEGCSYSEDANVGGCIDLGETGNSETNEIDRTTDCGPLPHTLVQTRSMSQNPFGPCVAGDTTTCWRVQDADGNWITSEFCQTGVLGAFCSDLDTSAPPTISEYTEC